ncbi:tetratricopeptide repeat protein [Flagellimonas sp. 389]|uniref:tetratricopeptide repeat-containing sensor histidine kinase n=1 Tax=Flagellimonas sp. 389 TaxID=2835862 RepID=UPI001BD2E37F|nr:sensor histidine kinase [Flagellimonas sp. 389]MBS9463067.1 tetratricopeptide repeat protein [Flagellimonas sp. 389]
MNKHTNTDIASINADTESLIKIVKDSTHLPISEKKKMLQDAEYEIANISNDTVQLKYLSEVSLIYKNLKDSLKFRQINQKVLEASEAKKIYTTLGNSHWDLASFYKSYGLLDSAYFHYRTAYKSFNKLPYSPESSSTKGRMLYSMGQIQDSFKDYLGAETSITSALTIFVDLEDYTRIYNCNNMLGIIANGMNNYEKALEYYEKAETNLKKIKSSNRFAYLLYNKNNIASAYLRSENYEKAKTAYTQLLKDENLNSEPQTKSLVLVGKAYSIFKSENDFSEAKSLLDNAIQLNDSLGFSSIQARTKQYYAELLAAEGDTINATKYAKESKDIAQLTSNNDRYLEVLKILTKLDSKNAVAYSDEYYKLSEKIKDEERVIRDKFARIRLETDEVIQKNEVLSRQKQIWIGVVISLLLFGAAVFTIILQRINNNKLKFQQKQQESNQEIYNLMLSQQGKFEEGKQLEQKRISEELHDGILGQMLGVRLILSGLNEKNDEASVLQRAELIEKLRDSEEEIRTISHELSNASYQKFYNFIVSLEDMINTISQSSGISCSFTYDDNVDWDDLEGDIKINAYRIVQESLQNCVKHAKCENVEIIFDLEGEHLKLMVKDDGVGFDLSKGKRGIGLRNITSRVKKVEGKLDIKTKKNEGTTIIVLLPNNYIQQENPEDILGSAQII